MGRPKKIRLNGERLRAAILEKGYTYRKFAEIVSDKENEDASKWINRLFLNDTDKNKTGVDKKMLNRMASVLGVIPEYLTGEVNTPSQEEMFFSELQRILDTREQIEHDADTLITPLLKAAGYHHHLSAEDDGRSIATFKRNNHEYMIYTDDLKKMEKACIDLCSSLLQSMGTDISTMITPAE